MVNFMFPVGFNLSYAVTVRTGALAAVVVMVSSWPAEMGFGK